MGIREWTIVLGVVVGVAVLLWMAARWRKRRYDEIYSYDGTQEEVPESQYTSELPSGGARTVGYRDPSDIERMNSEIRERADSLKPRLSAFEPKPIPRQQQSLFSEEEHQSKEAEPSEEQVPLLLDPSEEHSGQPDEKTPNAQIEDETETTSELGEQLKEAADEKADRRSDALEVEPPDSTEEQMDFVDEEAKPAEQETAPQVSEPESTFEPAAEPTVSEEPPLVEVTPKTSGVIQAEAEDKAETRSEGKAKRKSKSTQDQNRDKAKPAEPAEILIINLMTSADTPYEGPALLRALKELGMRFGDMDIFHYCGKHGDEPPQFRMANLLNPGVFDINQMDELRTHALCFFFELEAEQDNMAIYESMLSVISRLKDELGGEMRDDQRSVFTIQTSEHCRNRIRDFQRRHLLRKT